MKARQAGCHTCATASVFNMIGQPLGWSHLAREMGRWALVDLAGEACPAVWGWVAVRPGGFPRKRGNLRMPDGSGHLGQPVSDYTTQSHALFAPSASREPLNRPMSAVSFGQLGKNSVSQAFLSRACPFSIFRARLNGVQASALYTLCLLLCNTCALALSTLLPYRRDKAESHG